MKVLDFFKKKPKAEKPKKIDVKKKEEKPKPEKVKEKKPAQKVSDLANRVLRFTHVSEKATDLVGKSQYVFRVFPRANKTEIKKAIEELYGVNVVSVNIVKVHRKRRRLGRILGWRKEYKKAIVKIKKGEKIEVLSQ
ncbi:50S ribosomal protein L23 [Candidatus Parcubacteria bacterium]|nr:50S ribosomal protein L23 [Candidatus Parcubacteria bacterium]